MPSCSAAHEICFTSSGSEMVTCPTLRLELPSSSVSCGLQRVVLAESRLPRSDPKSTSPSTSPSPKLPGQTVRRESPEGPKQRQFLGRTELVQVCGQFLYRSGGADLVSHPGAHSGLDACMGASLVPRHPCHRSERSSLRRGRELEPRKGVLRLGSGPVVARLDAGERLDGTCGERSSSTSSLLAASRVPDTDGHGGPRRAVDVGRGFTAPWPDINRWEPNATPDQAVREASAARARSEGRWVRRGRAGPAGILRAGASERRP